MEYLFGDLILLTPWFIFYILRKDLRKEMLIMSIIASPLALFDLLYVPSYWTPITLFNIPVGIEGFIFSFIIGGLAAVSYAEINHKKIQKISRYHKHFSLAALALILPTAIVFKSLFNSSIAVAMYIALCIGIVFIVLLRKDLFKSTIFGSLFFGIIYSLALIIWSNLFPSTNFWFTFEGLPKVFVFNAPLYEIIFGFLFGAYWGNLYELIFGYRFK